MRWSWIVVCAGCASAGRSTAPHAAEPASLDPAPEQIDRAADSVACGPSLRIDVPATFATLARKDDVIVLASSDAALIVTRGSRDFSNELRAAADAFHLTAADFSQPMSVDDLRFTPGRLVANVSFRGRAYAFAQRRSGDCTAIAVEARPTTNDSITLAVAGSIDALPNAEPIARPSAAETVVELLGGAMRAGCFLMSRC